MSDGIWYLENYLDDFLVGNPRTPWKLTQFPNSTHAPDPGRQGLVGDLFRHTAQTRLFPVMDICRTAEGPP